ncbi:hypothetical protein V8F33_010572 [Rhypophila sp. PSN 637]
MPSLLVTLLPKEGFNWPRDQGAPRLLRADHRDAAVKAALVRVAGNRRTVSKKKAVQALREIFDFLTKSYPDADLGIQAHEDMVSWLFRVRLVHRLAKEIPANTWIEFVFQVVECRSNYHFRPQAAQATPENERSTKGSFAIAVDRFYKMAKEKWTRDFTLLLVFVMPDCNALPADWDEGPEGWVDPVEEEEEADDDDDDDEESVPMDLSD